VLGITSPLLVVLQHSGCPPNLADPADEIISIYPFVVTGLDMFSNNIKLSCH
jgi:hypothetical protein